LSELTSLSDKWIYFIKEAATLDAIPESLGEVSEIELALNIANQAKMTVEELETVDQRGMLLQDEKGRIAYAKEEAKEEGRKEGKEEGRKEGKEEGRKEGKEEGQREGQIIQAIAVVKRLLQKRFGEIPAATVSQVESLSLAELESLTEEIFDFTSLSDFSSWLERH